MSKDTFLQGFDIIIQIMHLTQLILHLQYVFLNFNFSNIIACREGNVKSSPWTSTAVILKTELSQL